MIIPSIDIQSGQTVQLIGGKELAIEAGDPVPVAQKFSKVGEIAVIDLDAAMDLGGNKSLVRNLLSIADCRVGGGIRDLETARRWLNEGAAKVIIGTAASIELVSQLPSERVIVALDAIHKDGNGQVVDHGWQKNTGINVIDRIRELKDYVGGFLITFVEREGRLSGIDLDTIEMYRQAAGKTKLTIAGGIASTEEIATLDALGIDAQVGMAIYNGQLALADCFCAPLKSDRSDKLWPTVVCDDSGQSLGLAYSNAESVGASLASGLAHYWSRKRGLWKKGETSGNTQSLLNIDVDCDRDTLRFNVIQNGDHFCHLSQPTCFGKHRGIPKLQSTLQSRFSDAKPESYSGKLFGDEKLLNAKIKEEGFELAAAESKNEIIHEAADVIYFAMAKLVKNGIRFSEVESELDRRARKVTRRDGFAKPEFSS